MLKHKIWQTAEITLHWNAKAYAYRHWKWGRRGRTCGPNILDGCRFGGAVIKYAGCLFNYLDTENRILHRSCVIKISMV